MFTIEAKCTSNILVNVPPALVPDQIYDASTDIAAKSKFWFPSFETTTSACQVEKYYVHKSKSVAVFPSGLIDQNPWTETHTIGQENANTFYISVIDGENPFKFNFVIYMEVNGGSTFTSSDYSLTTKCPDIHQFYSVVYPTEISSYKGAINGDAQYTFPKTVPKLPKCNEVSDYILKDISFNGVSTQSIIYFSPTCSTSPCMTLQFDTSSTGEITFKIQAVDLGGQAPLSSQLMIKIYENQQPPSIKNYQMYENTNGDSNKQETVPFVKKFVNEVTKFVFQPFTCTTGSCVVTNYQVSSSTTHIIPVSGLSGPTQNPQTGQLEVLVSNPSVVTDYSFYIRAELKVFPEIFVFSNLITISIVCGQETITVLNSPLDLGFFELNSGSHLIRNLDQHFVSTVPQCPIVDGVSEISIDSSTPIKQSLSVGAKSQLSSPGYLTINYVVCGNEEVKAHNSQNLIVKQIGEQITFQLGLKFEVTKYEHSGCRTITYSECAIDASGRIQIVGQQASVDTTTPMSLRTLCIEATSLGKQSDQYKVQAEVCGNEIISSLDTVTRSFALGNSWQKIPYQFQSSSENCGITGYKLWELQDDQIFKEYDGSKFSINNHWFQFVNNFPYSGTLKIEALASINKGSFSVNLKICGYEEVQLLKESPLQISISKTKKKHSISYKQFLQSNDTACGITSYQLEGQNNLIFMNQNQIVIYPSKSTDMYTTEVIIINLVAYTQGQKSNFLAIEVTLQEKLSTGFINYGPQFETPLFLQKIVYWDENGVFQVNSGFNYETYKLKLQLPLIVDENEDQILPISDYKCFKLGYANKYEKSENCFNWFKFSSLEQTTYQYWEIDGFHLKNIDSGRYKIEFYLQDEFDNFSKQELFILLTIIGFNSVDFKDLDQISKTDFSFFMVAYPCSHFVRIYSCTLYFTGEKDSFNHTVYTDIVEPSMSFNLPDEEFYKTIDPQVGIDFIDGHLSGYIFVQTVTKRQKEGLEPIAFTYVKDIMKYQTNAIVTGLTIHGENCTFDKSPLDNDNNDITVKYLSKAEQELQFVMWKSIERDIEKFKTKIVKKVDKSDWPSFKSIKIQYLRANVILQINFDKNLQILTKDQIDQLQDVFLIKSLARDDDSQIECLWPIHNVNHVYTTDQKKESAYKIL